MSTFFNKRTKKWQASYRENGRTVYCGYFNDQQSACKAVEARKNPAPKEELEIATADFIRLTSELHAAKIRMERAERAVNDSSPAAPSTTTRVPKWVHDQEMAKQSSAALHLHNIGIAKYSPPAQRPAISPPEDRLSRELARLDSSGYDEDDLDALAALAESGEPTPTT